ncbi:MAG: HEAT repeat domain-containing protein [Candidatus Eremiobacteraeota bacterium]|nr:HEAT repeat domain-containing protein [Candidatus Eremiobacteraeota bacterium]
MKLFGALAVASLAMTLSTAASAQTPPDPYARILTFEAARSLGNGELAADLNGSDLRLATRAALAIGRTRLPAGVPLLLAHALDARTSVRAFALYGLGLIGTKEGVSPMAAALGSRAGAVRIAALDALGRFETAHQLEPQLEGAYEAAIGGRLAYDTDPLVRARAAVELGAFGNSPESFAASLSLVRAIQTDTSDSVRWHALWAVYRGYATRVPRELLTACLHDHNELVRIQAVRAYGRLKDKKAIAALQPLLDDASWRVQEQANESILILGGKPQSDHLTALLPNLHLPQPAVDPFVGISALARTSIPGKPVAPTIDAAAQLSVLPVTAAQMLGPAHGPHPRLRIVTTKGDLYLTLYPEWAPLTVENFLNVADHGYFDNDRWFRIVPDFVVQTGDPTDNGDGDAGYTIGAEENPLEQVSDIISMGMNYTDPPNAHAIRDSAGTQFYITLSPQLHLNRDFTVFGALTGGQDILARLVESDRMIRVERLPDVTL